MAEAPGRLLVVDDNKVNRLLLVRALELQGHRVAAAVDGRQALETLRREPFELMLLDIEMPDMDGFQVLQVLQAERELRDVAVLVTSGLEGLANVVRRLELRADDYLHKTVNTVLLKARVDSRLRAAW